MNRSTPFKAVVTAAVSLGALCAGAGLAEAADYDQTNLVSDISGLAKITDTELINPWGISHSATSPFWISNQVTNTSTLYAVTGTGGTDVTKVNINPPTGYVGIPTTASGPRAPPGRSTTQTHRPSWSGMAGMADPPTSSSPI